MNAQIVFSSSATVYGDPEYTPLDEKHRLQVQQKSAHAYVADQSPDGLVVDGRCFAYRLAAAVGRAVGRAHHARVASLNRCLLFRCILTTPPFTCSQALNPYGRSKLIIEDMLRDLFAAEKDWRIVLLRYFNPVGAHPSGGSLGYRIYTHAGSQRLCVGVAPAGLRPSQQSTMGRSQHLLAALPCRRDRRASRGHPQQPDAVRAPGMPPAGCKTRGAAADHSCAQAGQAFAVVPALLPCHRGRRAAAAYPLRRILTGSKCISAGGPGAAGGARRVRRRLRHARRHRRAGLHVRTHPRVPAGLLLCVGLLACAVTGPSPRVKSRCAASCSHVVDLAEGHVAALKNIESRAEPYCDPINLGTGRGTSVLEMIKVMEAIPWRVGRYDDSTRAWRLTCARYADP
jgi:hypothetical protein